MSWLKTEAPANILSIVVTLDVFHPVSGRLLCPGLSPLLNADAPLNMRDISVTPEVIQLVPLVPIYWLKFGAYMNIDLMVVTDEVFHPLSGKLSLLKSVAP